MSLLQRFSPMIILILLISSVHAQESGVVGTPELSPQISSVDGYLTTSKLLAHKRSFESGLSASWIGGFLIGLAIPNRIWEESSAESYRLLTGGLGLFMCYTGVRTILTPSQVERDIDSVFKISDPSARQAATDSLLSSIAIRRRSQRTLSGVGLVLLANYHLIAKPWSESFSSVKNADLKVGVCYLATGLAKLIFKSREETTFLDFRRSTNGFNSASPVMSVHPFSRRQIRLLITIW